jgi:hypothetical protein
VLVIGSRNSSNSQPPGGRRARHGAEAHLIDNERQVRDEWLEGVRVVGISSGASAPEELVQRARRLLPRPRHADVAGVRGRARGRALHAAQGDPPDGRRAARLTRTELATVRRGSDSHARCALPAVPSPSPPSSSSVSAVYAAAAARLARDDGRMARRSGC